MTERPASGLAERGGPAGRESVAPAAAGLADRALAGLDDLESRPLAEHHDRLATAHELLQAALDEQPAPER